MNYRYKPTPVATVVPKNAKVIGPFPADTTPVRPGLYRRDNPAKTGQVWSFWTGTFWSMYGRNLDRCLSRKFKRSKHQQANWYALDRAA